MRTTILAVTIVQSIIKLQEYCNDTGVPGGNEGVKTVSVEMTADEGIYLLDAITARLNALKDVPRTDQVLREAQALITFCNRMTPIVKDAVRQEVSENAARQNAQL